MIDDEVSLIRVVVKLSEMSVIFNKKSTKEGIEHKCIYINYSTLEEPFCSHLFLGYYEMFLSLFTSIFLCLSVYLTLPYIYLAMHE